MLFFGSQKGNCTSTNGKIAKDKLMRVVGIDYFVQKAYENQSDHQNRKSCSSGIGISLITKPVRLKNILNWSSYPCISGIYQNPNDGYAPPQVPKTTKSKLQRD